MSFDTQTQNFWKESINKEAQVRLTWHLQYSKAFARGDYKRKPRKPNMVPNPIRLIKPIAKQSKTEKQEKTDKPDGKQNPIELIEMRPVSVATKQLLYTGLSAEGEGRQSYLQVRKTLKPEEKYDYPLTNAWLYGWKINEVSDVKSSRFGRTKIVKDSFYRENGVF